LPLTKQDQAISFQFCHRLRRTTWSIRHIIEGIQTDAKKISGFTEFCLTGAQPGAMRLSSMLQSSHRTAT